ncbi:sortase-dependent protein [Kitasatospora sp. NPDC101155]|uniref:sortase-dependent protein n=1 Tax=Kitasatospora sp. NPDC101155 TaxID=3364097 RepID=UPI0037F2E357
MSRTRIDRSPARRMLAVCALTGAALMAAVTGGQAWADGTPQPAPTAHAPANGAPAGAAAGGTQPSAVPARPAQPQVREVPKGAAQAGDGSAATDGNGLMLAGGGGVAAVGAGALGFALLRRRSGARG